MLEEKDFRASRRHIVLQSRAEQLALNLIARNGGGPYLDARLSRFPCESRLSWEGHPTYGIIPRKKRAFVLNYAGRIVNKINQYVFGQNVARQGIDDAIATDATKTGRSINQLWERACACYLAGQWAWVGVDRGRPGVDPATGKPGLRSIAQREKAGDRIFFSVWTSTEVPDWHFDGAGNLDRLITEEALYDNSDVRKAPAISTVRTIWEPGGGTRLFLNADDRTKIDREEPFEISAQLIPFVLLGIPSSEAYWFDDVERVQGSLVNLESVHHENLIKSVYPQLVIPASLIEEVMRLSGKGYEEAVEIVRGLDWPIMEPDTAKGITRYLTPNASDLKAIPDEILRRRRELFEIVGLALGTPDSKQVQSAASKAWDNLDPTATLAATADVLEEGETKAVRIAKELDSSFKEYDPAYPRQFDLPNIQENFATLLELNNVDLPESLQRQVMKALVALVDRIIKIPDDAKAEILAEIDTADMDKLRGMAGNAIPAAGPGFPGADNPDGNPDDVVPAAGA